MRQNANVVRGAALLTTKTILVFYNLLLDLIRLPPDVKHNHQISTLIFSFFRFSGGFIHD